MSQTIFVGGDLTILKIFPSEADLCDIKTNIPCPVDHCPRIFKSSSNLTMHLEEYHKLIEPNRSSLEKKSDNVIYQYYCPVKSCQYHDNIKSNKKKIFFDQLKYLKQHFLKVHSEKRFTCSSCDKSFSIESALKCHLGECGIEFKCSGGQSYTSCHNLLLHATRKNHSVDDKYRRDKESGCGSRGGQGGESCRRSDRNEGHFFEEPSLSYKSYYGEQDKVSHCRDSHSSSSSEEHDSYSPKHERSRRRPSPFRKRMRTDSHTSAVHHVRQEPCPSSDPQGSTLIKYLTEKLSEKETEVVALHRMNERLKIEKADLEKYILIPAIRSRIEELERMFLPPTMRKLKRKEKWNCIMFGNAKNLRFVDMIMSLRGRILPQLHKEFVLMITKLYGDFSDIAARKIKYPTVHNEKSVIETLIYVDIKPNKTNVSAIAALLAPL